MVTTPTRGDTNWDVALNAALNNLQSQTDGKVSKAGDTLTGSLNLPEAAQINIGSSGSGAPLAVRRTNNTDATLSTRVGAETASRFFIEAVGTHQWSDGTNGADVNLYRSAANVLKTDDTFTIGTGTLNLGASVNLYAAATNLQTDNYFVAPTGQSSGQWNVFGGAANSLNLGTAGGGVAIKTGSNARLGTATLVAGTVTVANTSVTANTKIFLSRATTGGTPGHLSYTKINGTSFTINASGGADTSTVDWLLVEAS